MTNPTSSHIHCGTTENFERVRSVLLALQVDHLRFTRPDLTVYVLVPAGTNPDEHQDALTAIANAVTT